MTRTSAPLARYAAATLALALLAALGLHLTRGAEPLAAVWLPNALAVAWLLRHPRSPLVPAAAAVLLGTGAANLLFDGDPLRAAGLGLANAIEVALAVGALRRIGCGRPDMERTHDLVRFSLIGGLVAPALSATLAAGVLALTDGANPSPAWRGWAGADGLGLLIATPVALLLSDGWAARIRSTRAQAWEWSILLGGGLIALVITFAQSRFPFLFLTVPVVLVLAFRLGSVGVALTVLALAIIAPVATAFDLGPVARMPGSMADKLFVLQLFLLACFGTGVPVAAALAGRDATRAELAHERDFSATMLSHMREVLFRTDADDR